MQAIFRLIVLAAIFDLLSTSHLHSSLNFHKKSKVAKYSVEESSDDASGIGSEVDSDFNKTLDNVQRNNILNSVGGMKQKMEGAVLQISIIANTMVKKKTGLDVAGQLAKANTQAAKFTLSSPANTRRLGKGLAAAEAAAGGLVTLVQGIQSGSWQDAVSGGLAIAASIAAFMGPVGVLFSVGLSIFSAIFGMFGGATGGEESTEDMTKRLLEDALLEETAEDLRAEASGLKRVYGSLSKTTANLRKANTVTSGQAVEFYNQAFVGVKLFGILEYYIDKWCNIGDYQSSKKEETNKIANRCLEFVNLYCDLAILRQLLVSDMASFMVEKGLEDTAKNLLGLVAEEQRSDMQFLRIIFDPIDHRRQRYVTAKYVSAMEKYTTLTDYLKKLDDISIMETEEDVEPVEPVGISRTSVLTNQSPRKLLKEFVMYCTGTILQKDCYENSVLGVFDRTKKEFKKMEKKIKSLYLTANRTVRIFAPQDRRTSILLSGPGVYSMLHEYTEIKNLEISTRVQTKEVKVCEKENMEMDGECTAFPIGNIADLEQKHVYTTQTTSYKCQFPFRYQNSEELNYGCFKSTKHVDSFWCPTELASSGYTYLENWGWCKDYSSLTQLKNWNKRITSLSIPAMLEITGQDTAGKVYGPYYGPSVIYKLPNPRTWKSLEIKESNHQTQNMVKVCSADSLGGFCDHLIPPEEVTPLEADFKEYNLNNFHGTDWTQSNFKPQSMKIPGGIIVHLFDPQHARFGPYKGPATITKVDGNGPGSTVSRIEIQRIY